MIAMDDTSFRLAEMVLIFPSANPQQKQTKPVSPIPTLIAKAKLVERINELHNAGYDCNVAHPVSIQRNADGEPLWINWVWYEREVFDKIEMISSIAGYNNAGRSKEEQLDAIKHILNGELVTDEDKEENDPIPDPPQDEHPQEEIGLFDVSPMRARHRVPTIYMPPEDVASSLPGHGYATFPSWLPNAIKEFTSRFSIYKINSMHLGGIGEAGPSMITERGKWPAVLWQSEEAVHDSAQSAGVKAICAATGVSGHQAMCNRCGKISTNRGGFLRKRRGWEQKFEQFVCSCS